MKIDTHLVDLIKVQEANLESEIFSSPTSLFQPVLWWFCIFNPSMSMLNLVDLVHWCEAQANVTLKPLPRAYIKVSCHHPEV